MGKGKLRITWQVIPCGLNCEIHKMIYQKQYGGCSHIIFGGVLDLTLHEYEDFRKKEWSLKTFDLCYS